MLRYVLENRAWGFLLFVVLAFIIGIGLTIADGVRYAWGLL